jgi:uncharacterized membrane protein
MDNQPLEEARFEKFLGNLLRAGVLLAATVVLFGGILYLIRHGGDNSSRSVFRGEPADLRNVSGIWEDAMHLSGRGMIQAGLLLLVATPVARVIFSVFGFFRERDYTYVVLTLIVLGVLLFSLFFGDKL